MDIEAALKIISGGESLTVEFKRRRSPRELNDRDLVEAVACMANGQGGHIFIGVEDDGTVSGTVPWHKTGTDPRAIESLIQNRTLPSLATSAHLLPAGDVEILVIEVPRSLTPIATQHGVYLRRVLRATGDPQCLPMDPAYLFSQYHTANARDWATLPAIGATLDDLDPGEFHRLRRLIAAGPGDRTLSQLDDEEILRGLGLYDDSADPVKVGAVLLFGTPPALTRWIPNHEVLLQIFSGTAVKVNFRTRGPLLQVMEEVADRREPYRHEDEINVGIFRIGLVNLPERASREAVANALVHRDYTMLGPIQIKLDDDEFRVTSPGGLPRPVTLDTIFDASTPRSPALADAFKRAGLVERSGRGVKIMFESMLTSGHMEPDFHGTTDEVVSVGLPVTVADREFAAFTARWTQSHPELSVRSLRLVRSLRNDGPSHASGLAERLSESPHRIARELTELTDLGLVVTIPGARSNQYRLGPVFHDIVGRRGDFVRSSKVDETRATQLLLAYVDDFGSINRTQAADTCGISGQQAYRFLRELVDTGELVMEGRGRGTRYVRPS